jgi:hypothetical protein
MTTTFRAPIRLAFAVIGVAALAGLAACGDLTRPKATFENFTDTLVLYAINGTPLDAPVGLSLTAGAGIPVNGGYSFDLAWDIDAQSRTTMYSVRAVAGGLSSSHSVGFQRVQQSFDALTEAQKSGFVTDSSSTVSVGDVFAIVTTDPNAVLRCNSYFSNQVYAKLEVLEINPGNRTVKTRFTVNPNCGYLSLAPTGIPNR